MSNQYLMVENKGVVGIELVTVMGASTARGDNTMIGKFGSGAKLPITLCLREGLELIRTIGKDVYTYEIDERTTRDVRGHESTIEMVIMRQIGGSSRKRMSLNIDKSLGSDDWTHINMGLREIVSNACDASKALQGDYKGVRIELVDDPQKFARDGYTRVFVQANAEVRRFFNDLHKHFLILRKGGFDTNETIIPKEKPDTLRVYRNGVLVGEFNHYQSLFDYNLNNISLKESRVIDDYDARYEIAGALKNAKPEYLAVVMDAIATGRDVFEVNDVDHSSMALKAWDSPREKEGLKEQWAAATHRAFAGKVVCKSAHEAEQVEMKGYDSVIVPESVAEVLQTYGDDVCRMAHAVLDHFEVNGREKIELGEELRERATRLWERLQALGMTKDKPMPTISGYHDVMNAGRRVFGYRDPKTNTIGINSDTFDSPMEFTQTLLEEMGHYATQAADCTRDMQDWAFKVAAKMMVG